MPSMTFTSSEAMVAGSQGGVKVISTFAVLTPSIARTRSSTDFLNIGPTGHMGEVSVIMTVTVSPFSPSVVMS